MITCKKKYKLIVFTAFLSTVLFFMFFFCYGNSVKAAYEYPNVILDENLRNYRSMSVSDIDAFLKANNSWLYNYTIPGSVSVPYPCLENGEVVLKNANSIQQDKTGASLGGKKVSQVIYDLSKKYNVNPQVILVMLQKESTSITRSSPQSQTVEQWPLFYGYNERMEWCIKHGQYCQNCSDSSIDYKNYAEWWGGAGKQLANVIWYFDNWQKEFNHINGSYDYTTPISIDGNNFTCENASTRLLYRYTPHGQFNFFNIYNDFWKDEPNVMLVNDTESYSKKTYDDNIYLKSHKSIHSKVYNEGKLIADYGPGRWQFVKNNLVLGKNSFKVDYIMDNGVREYKNINVQRHKMGDINGDSKIDFKDLSEIMKNWGRIDPVEYMANMNQSEDNVVNIKDLSIMASQWGK